MIRTFGLTKYYGKTRALEALELKVDPGEIFGLLGPNGSGKTTTIRLLMDFIRPTTGRAEIFGINVRSHSRQIRRRIGNVPGDVAFFETLKGHDLLNLADRTMGQDSSKRRHALADRLDIDLARPIRTLSRGNRQKIALIHALAHNPEVLMLDEPTTGLDPFIQAEFLDILRENRDKGSTILLSSHLLPEVERICTRVGILREGVLVAVEEISDLHQKKTRHMEIILTTGQSWPQDFFVKGVQVIRQQGAFAGLTVTGSLQPLLAALAKLPVDNIIFPEASLEDTFMAYYKKETTP